MSIRAKLALLAATPALLAVVAVGIALAVISSHRGTLELEERVARYALLSSEQVRSAVAFDDRETARETFDAIAHDPAVVSIALYRADGTVLHQQGAATTTPPAVTAQPTRHGDRVIMTVPVVSIEGPRGTLTLALSTAALDSARRRMFVITAGAALLAVGLALLLGLPVARRMSRRITAIANVAGRIADGDLAVPPVATGVRDELGQTAVAVDPMGARRRASIAREAERAASEKARLEQMVAERTEQLTARDQDVRRILANVNQGLLTVTRTGVVIGERSSAVDLLMPGVTVGAPLAEAVRAAVPAVADGLALGFAQLAEDFLPIEVALDQLPRELTIDQRQLALAYAPIVHADDACHRVLITITDVSAERQRDRARAADHERVALFRAISSDRRGLERFLSDADAQIGVAAAAASPTPAVKAALHTLKGNSAALGLPDWPARCHAAEDELAEAGALSAPTRAALAAAWRDTVASARPWLEHDDAILLAPADLARLSGIAERAASWPELRAALAELVLEPTRQPLGRLAEHARQVASRLGRGAIEVIVDDRGLRLDPERWVPLWSVLVHVARNTVTHGVAAGGHVVLRSRQRADGIAIEIADDGAGIDWAAVAVRATALGLPAGDRAALTAALFADGLSTRDVVDEHAGRGVGLAAVAAVCAQLGVAIEVDSAPGRGTTFRFCLPVGATPPASITQPIRIRRATCDLAS